MKSGVAQKFILITNIDAAGARFKTFVRYQLLYAQQCECIRQNFAATSVRVFVFVNFLLYDFFELRILAGTFHW